MELTDKLEGYRSMVKGTLLQVCTLLLRHHSSQFSKEERKLQSLAFSELRSLLAYVEKNYTERIELKELAKSMGVSTSRASHRFLEATGRNFKDYLLQLRLNEARRQLIGTELPVTEVCFGSGFQSVPSFYRLFAEAEGISPMDYRRKYELIANSEKFSSLSKKT